MSDKLMPSVSSSQARLMEIFNTELLRNGNDPFSAFIATMDELDQRQQLTTANLQKVGKSYQNLAEWIERVDETLEDLPEAFKTAAHETKEPLREAARAGAANGAQSGLSDLERALEALTAAEWALEDTRASVRRKAWRTVPLTAFFVVASLWFFNNAIIPILPPTLEWPCKITGLDYGRSGEGADRFSYCIIAR